MRPAWRLATNSLAGRRLRTALLVSAVALSAGLIVAITCGVASLNAAVRDRMDRTVGVADARLTRIGDDSFDRAALDLVRNWDAVSVALPRSIGPVALINPETGVETVIVGQGVDPAIEFTHRPLSLLRGRAPDAPDEIVIEERAAGELGLDVGDNVQVASYFGGPPSLRIVGVTEKSAFWSLSRAEGHLDRSTLNEILGRPGTLRIIDILLDPGVDPVAFTEARKAELERGLILQPTERITSGLDRSIRSQRIGLTVISIIAFIAASFIILTGLTTNVLQQQRLLAIVRCVGGSRSQIASAQILVGLIIGGLGALIGVPLGIGLAWLGVTIFREHLHTGLVIPPAGVGAAMAGAILTGAGGAVWPAIVAARLSPLQALASRARPPRRSSLYGVTALGGAMVLLPFLAMRSAETGDAAFWIYTLGGVQSLFIGYFLLGAPLMLIVAAVSAPALCRALRIPRGLLTGAVRATPFRYGMTAAALMVGLSMMTVIWTAGGGVIRQWLGAIQFPDAFVHGWLGLTPEDHQRIAELPFVNDTCAVTLLEIDDAGAFGVSGLHDLRTTFVGFEPAPFFRMTNIAWIEGDEATATRRLEEGGAVIVAQEFNVARGLGVGDTFSLNHEGEELEFEIVGVIASPGLEIASRYFDIGKLYRSQAVSAVFGSRRDLIERFGTDAVQIIQIDLSDDISDEDAIAALRRLFAGTSLSVGSGREIKRTITSLANNSLTILSSVAVAAILIACLGVGNVIVAGIDARRFEFGVLRAVGAEGSLLTRLVLAEAVVMAITAGALGIALGLQASWSEMRLYRLLIGLDLSVRPPVIPIAIGWLIVLALATLAAAPPALRLARRPARELLATGE